MSKPRQRIFLLSHMRAYTSLMGHILGSHPAIDGYYEMHLGYQSERDLEEQERLYRLQGEFKSDSHYLFDKLLHNDYRLDLQLPGLRDALVLLSLRPPEPTLKSILSLFARKGADDPYATPEGACAYYVERLAWLATFARDHTQRYYYFDAELIRPDTERLLRTLSNWLGLEIPLSPDYRRQPHTGLARAGDTSAAIGSGRVIGEENRYPEITLDAGLLGRATQAYQICREELLRNASASITLDPSAEESRIPG